MPVEDEGRAGDSRCCCMIKFFRGSIKGESDRQGPFYPTTGRVIKTSNSQPTSTKKKDPLV